MGELTMVEAVEEILKETTTIDADLEIEEIDSIASEHFQDRIQRLRKERKDAVEEYRMNAITSTVRGVTFSNCIGAVLLIMLNIAVSLVWWFFGTSDILVFLACYILFGAPINGLLIYFYQKIVESVVDHKATLIDDTMNKIRASYNDRIAQIRSNYKMA